MADGSNVTGNGLFHFDVRTASIDQSTCLSLLASIDYVLVILDQDDIASANTGLNGYETGGMYYPRPLCLLRDHADKRHVAEGI